MGVEETNFPMFLSSKSLEKVSKPPNSSHGYLRAAPRSAYTLRLRLTSNVGEVCIPGIKGSGLDSREFCTHRIK